MLLPDPGLIHVEYLSATDDAVTLVATTCQMLPRCPDYHGPAERVHSRYDRTVADQPWKSLHVRLYIPPNEVTSPRQKWALIAVLDEGSEGQAALAVGLWDKTPVLAMRWNGNAKNPIGNPQSRGLATWFIVPGKYRDAIIQSANLPGDKLALTKGLFGI